MFQKWKKFIFTKAYIILPIMTLFCLTGFIGSLVFPDTALDTYSVNMEEEEGDAEVLLSLSDVSHVGYKMDTNGLSMRGIQVGINKQGFLLTGNLCYDVYTVTEAGERVLVSENTYALSEGDDLQYVYLPYNNYENCVGRLFIDFYTTRDENGLYPALMANHSVMENTITTVETGSNPADKSTEEEQVYGLKCSYIYTHKTYPLLYDFRILTFIFLAAAMAVEYPKRKSRKGGVSHE